MRLRTVEGDGAAEQTFFSWLNSDYFGDDGTRLATRRVLREVNKLIFCTPHFAALHFYFKQLNPPPVFLPKLQLAIFYVLIIIGFAALWITWKSNARIRRVREEMKQVLRQQKEATFDPDSAKMYGMY